ncbi:MAG: ROK family glucokinase, partial [Mycobacteriales bacterium]|nr:ROK family glucokinase [Frankia sp.]
DVVAQLRQEHDVVAVGVGAAGFIDAGRERVLFAPNVAGWRDEPLRARVQERVDLPVVIENDANAAAWAEYRFGAGQGADPLVVVTVGTGIGSGIVSGGELVRGHYGIAAEAGHLTVVPDGAWCGCGNRGCWEQYASGGALTRKARERARTAPTRATAMLALAGDVDGIHGEHVTRAARDGDALAREVFDEVGDWLGRGLATIAALLDPECFVVGGGAGDAGDLLLGPARVAFARHLTGHDHRPLADIRAARFGNDAGVIGVADLARRAQAAPAA